MEITLRTLLTKPGQFFANFSDLPPKWIIAYIGYYLVTFIEAVGNLADRDLSVSITTILYRSIFSSLWGAIANLFFFGILWMYLGSKIFGGRAPIKDTVQAVGYAFLYPGIISLITVPLTLLSAGYGNETSEGLGLICLLLPLQLVLGIAALLYSGIAIKQLNGFGWLKTLGVLVWFPLLIIGFVIIISIIR